jgi:putative ABC transport system substrate-binding protein
MSAFGGKADIIQEKAGIKKCSLMIQSGHQVLLPISQFGPVRCLVLGLGGTMKRREFIQALVGSTVCWPLVAVAQQSGIPVIGYLGLTSAKADAYLLVPFRRALSEAGFDEGRNVVIEYQFAERDVSRLPQLATELVRRKVSVIFTGTSVSALATKAATSTIPVIFAIGADPVKSGLVTSLNRPGGNLTGISFFTNQMEAKRLALLHEIVPKAELVGVLLNPNNPFFAKQSSDVEEASRALKLKIHIERASNAQEITKAFNEFAQRKVGALLVGADPYFNSQRSLVIAPAAELRVPAIYEWREFPEAGGLMSYGTSLTEAYRQAGDFVARVLKGANPADLPVLQASKFEFVINLKTAKALDRPSRHQFSRAPTKSSNNSNVRYWPLALSGHPQGRGQCLLSGVNRTRVT